MKKATLLTLTLIVIGVLTPIILQNYNKNPDRTPWANQWTQQFESHADGSQTWSGGLVYYSWKLKAYKVSFQRSVFSPCQFFGSYLSECSWLVLDNVFYIIWPMKKMCAPLSDQIVFPAPYQTAVDSMYLNTTNINGTDYYVWNSKSDSSHYLYTSADEKQVNFWQYDFTSNYHLNEYRYLPNSYYPVIQQDVFQLPQYCQISSNGMKLNDQQKEVLMKMFKIKNNQSLKKLN